MTNGITYGGIASLPVCEHSIEFYFRRISDVDIGLEHWGWPLRRLYKNNNSQLPHGTQVQNLVLGLLDIVDDVFKLTVCA